MRVFLTGAWGQLGSELVKVFDKGTNRYEVVKTDIHNLDITDHSRVMEAVRAAKPDVVINCAAYTNVDGCETEEIKAFRVNAIGAQNLSVAAYQTGAKIVQLSTDYVFDGTSGIPLREYDPVNPQCCYGKSKALGEKLVRETNPKHFIVRTAWLYGNGSNFVKTMLRLSREKKELNVVCDQVGTPTSCNELALCIRNLIHTDSYGTYHATCEGECSWYEFAREIFKLKGIKTKVNKVTSEYLDRPAKRPKYSVLENYMLKLLDMNTFRNWEDALRDYLKGVDNR